MTRKPIIVVSRCLGFAVCRWNGATIENNLVNDLGQQVEFITVCPECEVGLGVPRQPILMVQKDSGVALIQPATGADLTCRMITFSHIFLDSLDRVDGFLLKRKSPSCGLANVPIYAEPDDEQPLDKGPGFFARAVLERFPDTPIEDEGCLEDLSRREKWLTAVAKRSKIF
ncbi:MAG: DUF523 domain-containing protein [Pseudomonadota bacterium]|nr:DUF523 domain-containing protein [Pseudomonadota bacterium]